MLFRKALFYIAAMALAGTYALPQTIGLEGRDLEMVRAGQHADVGVGRYGGEIGKDVYDYFTRNFGVSGMAFHIEPDLYDVMVLNLVNGVHTAGRWAQPLEQLGAGWHTSNAMLHAIPFHRPNIYVGFRDLKVPKEGGPPFRSVVVAVVYHHVAPNTFHIVGGFRLPTAWLNMARTQLPRYAPAFKFEGHRYHLQGFIKLD